MPIAHSCASCGLCLTRVRAGLDPLLKLQVIVCPHCSTPCVRRRDPVLSFVRNARLLIKCLIVLSLHAFLFVLFTGFAALLATVLRDLSSEFAYGFPRVDAALLDRLLEHNAQFTLLAFVMMGLLVGLWVRASTDHVPSRWKPWATLVIAVIAGYAAALLLVNGHDPERALSAHRWTLLPFMLASLLAFAPLGALIARAVLRRSATSRARRFRRVRAYVQRRRNFA